MAGLESDFLGWLWPWVCPVLEGRSCFMVRMQVRMSVSFALMERGAGRRVRVDPVVTCWCVAWSDGIYHTLERRNLGSSLLVSVSFFNWRQSHAVRGCNAKVNA